MAELSEAVKEQVGAAVAATIRNNPEASFGEIGDAAIKAMELSIHPTSPIRLLPFLEQYDVVVLGGSKKPDQEGVSRVVQLSPEDGQIWSCRHQTKLGYSNHEAGKQHVVRVHSDTILPPTGQQSPDAPVQGAAAVPPSAIELPDYIRRNQG